MKQKKKNGIPVYNNLEHLVESSILAELEETNPLPPTMRRGMYRVLFCVFVCFTAEDQVVVSSDYDSTHEANHSDSSDVAHTEEDAEQGKTPGQNVILHSLIPPEVSQTGRAASSRQNNTRRLRCVRSRWCLIVSRRTNPSWLPSRY